MVKQSETTVFGLLIKGVAWCVALAIIYLLLGLILVNLAMGCGEVIYFENGTWETGECWLIPYETTQGSWR